ncbi:MAG: 3'(2'),5'-bisphosphate nucleotidase CysQ [Pseudonocardiales bacterium]|nr:MAG: 3'(2'),5'-bisphosphate nucleotidase CysQ [Pseudonocardiales bacterium]
MTAHDAPDRSEPGITSADDDATVARALAEGAGRGLVQVREELGFADAAALRQAGDRTSQEFLADRLTSLRPDDRVLSEEAADDPRRLTADRVWIIDPLDGTREFSEDSRTDWAVHVALWQGGRLTAGAVALPARGLVLGADAPPQRAPWQPGRAPRIAVSRTRPPWITAAVARALGAELVPMGSAGAKVAAVVLGDVDAYVHGGGQYEWDSAAPVAVALAAGLHATRLDGSPLCYNRPDPSLPDLLVCVPELAAAILEVTGPHSASLTTAGGGL